MDGDIRGSDILPGRHYLECARCSYCFATLDSARRSPVYFHSMQVTALLETVWNPLFPTHLQLLVRPRWPSSRPRYQRRWVFVSGSASVVMSGPRSTSKGLLDCPRTMHVTKAPLLALLVASPFGMYSCRQPNICLGAGTLSCLSCCRCLMVSASSSPVHHLCNLE